MHTTSPVPHPLERDIHGDGGREYIAYTMPRRGADLWAAITSYPDRPPVQCPVPDCAQHLVWYEAGYVSGYRVCMAAPCDGGYESRTIRHRFLLDPYRTRHTDPVLILDDWPHDPQDDY